MTTIDNSVPLAVAVRLEVQEAVSNHSRLDYKAILERIETDGRVDAAELRAVQQALVAEVEAGHIDDAKAKGIMQKIAGRLAQAGSAADRRVIRETIGKLDTLSMTVAQLDAAMRAATNAVDRGLLAKDVRTAAADGTIAPQELEGLWQKALGSDGHVSVADVRAIYAALDKMLKSKKIDQKQFESLRRSMDAALLARSNAPELTRRATDYIEATSTAHALTGDPNLTETWANAIDMLAFAAGEGGANQPIGHGTVIAFADMVSHAARPISDVVARAVAKALDGAVSSGKITKEESRDIAATLDRRIANERFGVGARADFSLVTAALRNQPPTTGVQPVRLLRGELQATGTEQSLQSASAS